MSETSATDDEFLALLRSGDPASFDRYYAELFPLISRVAQRYGLSEVDAEDVCVDTFLRVFQRLQHSADPVPNMKVYTLRAARNVILDYLRRGHRSLSVERFTSVDISEEVDSLESIQEVLYADDPALAVEQREILSRAIAMLSASERAVVYGYIMGKSTPEIADELGVNYGTVSSRLHRALSRLRTKLLEDEEST